MNALTGLDAEALYLPLIASGGAIGVVGLRPRKTAEKLDQGQLGYLEAFINQTGIAIERALLAEESHRAMMKAETESLRNTLLSSISHDLRTPVTSVAGAVSTLLTADASLDKQSPRELLETIQEESERLSRIIKNVLAMTRLESGIAGRGIGQPGSRPLVPHEGRRVYQGRDRSMDQLQEEQGSGCPSPSSASVRILPVLRYLNSLPNQVSGQPGPSHEGPGFFVIAAAYCVGVGDA